MFRFEITSEIEPEALADFRLNDSGDRLEPQAQKTKTLHDDKQRYASRLLKCRSPADATVLRSMMDVCKLKANAILLSWFSTETTPKEQGNRTDHGIGAC